MCPARARRRPRTARLVAAVVLLLVAGLVVLAVGLAAALAEGLAGWPAVAVLVGLSATVLGAAAVRLTHSELMSSRLQAAADRAAQARAYGALADRRHADHSRHVARLYDLILERQRSVGRLQRELAATRSRLEEERRLAEAASDELVYAERRADESDLRAAQAIVTVAELEHRVIDLEATLAAWETTGWTSTVPLRRQA